MADLKFLYQSLGFADVTTYIQSGNVIFQSEETNKEVIRLQIEQIIEAEYSFHVPVDIRTAQEVRDIVSGCPYNEANIEANGTKVLVAFLLSEPDSANISALSAYVKPPEKLLVQGSVVYLYCPNGYGKSKLSNVFLEKKLAVRATTRNWKSVNKLCEISAQ